MLREADKLLNNKAQSEENWKRFKENWQRFRDAFTTEFPNSSKPDKELPIAYAAEKAGLKPFYGSHYRIYCQYTHGALRASIGSLDEATNPEDNRIVAICALGALDNLISMGAESPNRNDLVQRLQRAGQPDARAETG